MMVSKLVPSEPIFPHGILNFGCYILLFYACPNRFESHLHAFRFAKLQASRINPISCLSLTLRNFTDKVACRLQFFFSADCFGKGTPTLDRQSIDGVFFGGYFFAIFSMRFSPRFRSSTVKPFASAFGLLIVHACQRKACFPLVRESAARLRLKNP